MNEPPPRVRIYTTRWCPFCVAAKRLFDSLGVEYEEFSVDRDPQLRQRVSAQAGGWPTVPMIFVDDAFIGGYSDARTLHARGKLLAMFEPAGVGRP